MKIKSGKKFKTITMLAMGVFIVFALTCKKTGENPGPRYGETPGIAVRQHYHFAVHPLHNPQKLAIAYQPLMDYLNENIPEVFFYLEASRDYQAYEEKINKSIPEFLLPNPWQTLQAIKAGYQVLAMAGDAEDFKGIFIVRKDSPVRNPSDLKGKTISYPSHTALAACIMPQYFLHHKGINVRKDIENVYVGSQESSIMNAYLGKSAAAATWPPPWRLFQKDFPAQAAELKLIWETESLVNNSVMARNDVPANIAQRVRDLLLSLHKNASKKAILTGMETARFHWAGNTSYDKVRAYVEEFEKEVRRVEER